MRRATPRLLGPRLAAETPLRKAGGPTSTHGGCVGTTASGIPFGGCDSSRVCSRTVHRAEPRAPSGGPLTPDDAHDLFTRIMRNVELWLAYNVVHGDLSAFNILWWEGNVTIIDVPQAVDPRVNPNARDLLARDIDNVCRYFSRCGVRADPARLAARLWTRFLHAEL